MACFAIQYLESPKVMTSYLVIAMVVATSTFQVITVESLFLKMLPREIRGALMLILTLFLDGVSAIFNYVGGPIFDKISPAAPFTIVAYCDGIFFILAMILAMSGKLTLQNIPDDEDEHGKIIKDKPRNGAQGEHEQ